jgi:hypothetical protein
MHECPKDKNIVLFSSGEKIKEEKRKGRRS